MSFPYGMVGACSLTVQAKVKWLLGDRTGDAETRHLYRGAAVHDHVEARGACALRGGLVDNAELHPDGGGADLDRLVHMPARLRRAAEDVDHVDLPRNLAQRRVAANA